MTSIGHLALRDRSFKIKLAEVIRRGELWGIEIETQEEEFDGENWSPYLYHQGLRLQATNTNELRGQNTSWGSQETLDYPHPEKGTMYVFGHHDVRDCKVAFGEVSDGRIQLIWEGLCDVFWDAAFKEDVPFRCECTGIVKST